MRSSFKYGLIALALSPLAAPNARAQHAEPHANIRIDCKGVADDALKSSIELLVNFAVVDANIDRRKRGQDEIPRFKFSEMPEEPTRRFIADLRRDGINGFIGGDFGVTVRCKDHPAP